MTFTGRLTFYPVHILATFMHMYLYCNFITFTAKQTSVDLKSPWSAILCVASHHHKLFFLVTWNYYWATATLWTDFDGYQPSHYPLYILDITALLLSKRILSIRYGSSRSKLYHLVLLWAQFAKLDNERHMPPCWHWHWSSHFRHVSHFQWWTWSSSCICLLFEFRLQWLQGIISFFWCLRHGILSCTYFSRDLQT